VYNVDHFLDQLVLYLNRMKTAFDPNGASMGFLEPPEMTYSAVSKLEDPETFFERSKLQHSQSFSEFFNSP